MEAAENYHRIAVRVSAGFCHSPIVVERELIVMR
jgi:hypothetical protein